METRLQEGAYITFIGANKEVFNGRIIQLNTKHVCIQTQQRVHPLVVSHTWLQNEAEVLEYYFYHTVKVPMSPYTRPSDWWKKIPAFGWLLYIIGVLFIAFGVESFWNELARDNRGFFWFGFLFLAAGFFVHWRSHSHVE